MNNALEERAQLFAQYVCAEIKGSIVSHGHSQADVAKGIGRQKANVSKWLNAKPPMGIDVAYEICEYINIPLDDIIERASKRVEKAFPRQATDALAPGKDAVLDPQYIADHPEEFGLVAKQGDWEAEQEAYMEEP